ncbi:MAG: DNA replication and repair protein RecF [Bacteroides sp.]|nr:DNA replication and repair protein RecF [Prevotella sp.]MCM1408814.1 DNA replication and repair protein RecF [Treponema brennaborense]MCM1470594.1 DNA replication and repair protein RecF [Bacteroides sp.]
MPFLSISLQNVRNIEDCTIDLLAKEVFFVGKNGQGKTNLLESLYISAYGTSFKTHSDNEIVKTGQSSYKIRNFFRNNSEKCDIVTVSYEKNKKRIEKNGKKIIDRKELISTIPCVLFCHEDIGFANGEPEKRRFFIDQSLSMYDIVYLDTLRKYKRALKTRNQLLKEKNYEMVDIYDTPLLDTGIEIVKKRQLAVFQFNAIFGKLYETITGISNVTISYESSWKDKNRDEIADILNEKREADKIMGTTMSGPHRDKIIFTRNKKLFIPTASTGQIRLVSILLRVSQAMYYSQLTGKKPVLLMDDVLLELDPEKKEKVISVLPEYDQLFCTFLPEEPYSRYCRANTRVYFVEKGKFVSK